MVVGDRGGLGATDSLLRVYRETGDLVVRQRLIERHLPLVRVLARRYAHRGEQVEDLVQVGSIGLIQAIDRFDPEKGSDFASFAVPTIAGEIKNHLRDRTNVVRIPRRAAALHARVRSEQASLTARLRRSPTLPELAQALEIGEDDAADAIEVERSRITFPLTTASTEVTAESAVDDPFETCDDRMLLAAGFRTLDARQRRILHLRFYAGLSQAEIAREVGLSQIQVSRVIRSSLERMRGALGRSGRGGPVEKPLASRW